MKVKVKIETEVELKRLVVKAGVRYWEDATVNGVEDEQGDLIPCREGDLWCPTIDLNTGVITNWESGKIARIHYKVCDAGSYYLQDVDGNTVLSIERDYVPDMLCPKESGYGDYIIMDVGVNGVIHDFSFSLSGFQDSED